MSEVRKASEVCVASEVALRAVKFFALQKGWKNLKVKRFFTPFRMTVQEIVNYSLTLPSGKTSQRGWRPMVAPTRVARFERFFEILRQAQNDKDRRPMVAYFGRGNPSPTMGCAVL